MASAELSRRVEKVVSYEALSWGYCEVHMASTRGEGV